jgi:acetyl-CoA C-acetyltransferase
MDDARVPVILSAARTPIGRLGGALASLKAGELGAVAVRAAVERAGLHRPDEIDEVLMGNVVAAGAGQNVARQAAILGGLPHTVGASSINKVCGAGLKAAMFAAQAIKAGDGELFVSGGVESMSNAPHLVRGRLGQMRFGNVALEDALLTDGLWCPFEDWPMGDAAEFIADQFEVSREAMDRYALASHQKAIAAIDAGRFDAEIAPVQVKWVGRPSSRAGGPVIVAQDEGPRRETSLQALAELKPAFKAGGRVTAGNAPGLNDGAAAVVIASARKAQAIGARPMARIVGYAQAAVEPRFIFDAPARAILRLLSKIGWTLDQVQLIELNEAFAAQVLANGYALADQGWDWDRVNVNGGAIALGHALGSTGARILTTLLHALRQRGLQRGIAALCLGGGEAVALAVEMLS